MIQKLKYKIEVSEQCCFDSHNFCMPVLVSIRGIYYEVFLCSCACHNEVEK